MTRDLHRTAAEEGRSAGSKDLSVTGTILAVAGTAWLGWGHAGERLTTVLDVGMIAGLLLFMVGVLLTRSLPGSTRMSTDRRARNTYWASMAGQVIAIVAGVALMNITERPQYVPPWVLTAVGVHFLPLARAFRTRVLDVAGSACIAVAALATVSGIVGWLPVTTVAGGGAGLVLLIAATSAYREARRG